YSSCELIVAEDFWSNVLLLTKNQRCQNAEFLLLETTVLKVGQNSAAEFSGIIPKILLQSRTRFYSIAIKVHLRRNVFVPKIVAIVKLSRISRLLMRINCAGQKEFCANLKWFRDIVFFDVQQNPAFGVPSVDFLDYTNVPFVVHRRFVLLA